LARASAVGPVDAQEAVSWVVPSANARPAVPRNFATSVGIHCCSAGPRLIFVSTPTTGAPVSRAVRTSRNEMAAAIGVVLAGLAVITAVVVASPGWQKITASWRARAASRSVMARQTHAEQFASSTVGTDAPSGEPVASSSVHGFAANGIRRKRFAQAGSKWGRPRRRRTWRRSSRLRRGRRGGLRRCHRAERIRHDRLEDH
jgi:hypothetical protein